MLDPTSKTYNWIFLTQIRNSFQSKMQLQINRTIQKIHSKERAVFKIAPEKY